MTSYMPNPANPQVGDRFANQDTPYTILGVDDSYVSVLCERPNGETWPSRWPNHWITKDTPLRTEVTPAVTDDCPPQCIVRPFPWAIGSVLTSPAWPEDKRVKVEWIGETAFGGTVRTGFKADDTVVARHGQVFDHKSLMNNWRVWQEPEPALKAYRARLACDHPAVKPYDPPRIKTVWRAPKKGEQYIPSANDGLRTANCDWGNTPARVLVVE